MKAVLATSSDMMKSLGLDIGSGAVVGLPIGYAAKKLFKVVMVLIGAQLAFLKWLESKGILTVDWSALANTAEGTTDVASSGATSVADMVLNSLGMTGGFAAGVLVGWKKG